MIQPSDCAYIQESCCKDYAGDRVDPCRVAKSVHARLISESRQSC